jgi:hypothetical protein
LLIATNSFFFSFSSSTLFSSSRRSLRSFHRLSSSFSRVACS